MQIVNFIVCPLPFYFRWYWLVELGYVKRKSKIYVKSRYAWEWSLVQSFKNHNFEFLFSFQSFLIDLVFDICDLKLGRKKVLEVSACIMSYHFS